MIKQILFPPSIFSASKLQRKIDGKTILITGASFGIGRELALLLSQFNCHLILAARTEEKLIEVKQEIDSKEATCEIHALDLRDEEKRSTFISSVDNLDYLILNAGKSIRRPLKDSLDRFHDITRTNDINYLAPAHLSLAFIPKLQNVKGKIINVSAINVLYPPPPFWAVYQASKTSFDQWFRANEIEMNIMGIRTSTIYLPLVRTRMIAPNEKYKKVPAMTPDQAAKRIAKLIYGNRRYHKPWWHYPILPIVWAFFPIYRWGLKSKLK